MSKKLECIQSLKSKLAEMKKQLAKNQKKPNLKQQNYQTEKLWLNKTTKLSDFKNQHMYDSLTKNSSWKNPTFWGTNPIVGKQNSSNSSSSKFILHKSPRHIKKQIYPQVLQLRNFANETYYDHTKQEQKPMRKREIGQNVKSHKYISNSGFYGAQKQTPRFDKIKTYEHPPTNPILNPEKQVQRGKKIVKKPILSPNTNLVQNPKSNPSLYLFKDKVGILSPKNSNKKNLSPYIKQLLSSSLEEKVVSPKKRSCKKHFTRYFQQTYQSKWN